MISYLKWKIIELDFVSLTILTDSGVWYEVWINQNIYNDIVSKHSLNESISPSWNTQIELYIYHHITEGAQSLFGFIISDEKKFFKELIKISWIGWKVAMQILSLWIGRLVTAVWIGDNKTIESIKWVWKKMAEKIILELKDKDFDINIVSSGEQNSKEKISSSLYESIKETLINMWYNPKNIDKILRELPKWMDNAWEILQYTIKELS